MKKNIFLFAVLLLTLAVSPALATIYTGVMDNRAGQQFIPGMTAQSKAWMSGGDTGEGVRLEWQVDNVTTLGSWTYTYRLLRGPSKNKGFAFFDIETAGDFTAANILSKQVTWALTKAGTQLLSGLAGVTISGPFNFNAVHDFSNAAVTEASPATALNKSELSHYSGDPGRVAPGSPGLDASLTPSVGPVPHPFYGLRVTFPGTLDIIAYEAVEWEFKIVSDRPPMWGSFFGWGDQTLLPPHWYSNMYNSNIDNPVRLTLPPASCNFGEAPYKGWILVPGPQPAAQSSFLTVDRASYSRDASGAGVINISATALANPNLHLTVSGAGFASPVNMAFSPLGKYFATIPYSSLPASVLLDNSFDPAAVQPYPVPLVDEVDISQAFFNTLTREITIKATSQDKLAPLPTLTAIDFGVPNQLDATGTFSGTLPTNPPANVTVISSRGGSATAKVSIVTPTAAPGSLTINAAAGPNGTISPAGSTPVTIGASQTYTITPDAGFKVASLVVDGVLLPGASTYTFSNIIAGHYINAYFEALPVNVTINAAAGPNGAISPAGATSVVQGASQSYTITPNAGFIVAALVVDGATLPGAASYTFTNVTTDHYINAYFSPAPATVTITAAAGPNGSISPAGATSVTAGTDQTYTITPGAGFTVTNLVVDGALLPGATSHTFTNVTADHYINAYFGP